MADYNRIILVGNLTRDPELKTLASGQPLCRLGLASNRQFKNRQTGAMIQEVCFIDIDVWGNQAESCKQYLQKGRAVLIEGRLKYDTWQDANGGGTRSKHTVVADKVVFLSSQGGATVSGDMSEMSDMDSEPGAARNPGSQLEKELLEQIGQIKEKAAKKEKPAEGKVVAAKRASKHDDGDESEGVESGEKKFQDEPPFEDDLPF